jgi:hypothetical protein
MNENPYLPPSVHEPAFVSLSPPKRGVCPVCQSHVSHFELSFFRSVVCGKCSTELALGMLKEDKIGLGCLLVTLLALLIIVVSLYEAINGDLLSMLYWLLLLVPLVGTYSSVTRWKHLVPYPKSLIRNGRIAFSVESDEAR